NSYFRNHGIFLEDFTKNITKLFKEYNLEYQVEERTASLDDYDMIKRKFITMFRVLKSMILEYSGMSNEKYDEMLDKTFVEITEYKTTFQLIRHFGKKLSV
ncbi:7355_t:CDS:2, partial [Scutellospora calospora]